MNELPVRARRVLADEMVAHVELDESAWPAFSSAPAAPRRLDALTDDFLDDSHSHEMFRSRRKSTSAGVGSHG
jgi:hypothetical protein